MKKRTAENAENAEKIRSILLSVYSVHSVVGHSPAKWDANHGTHGSHRKKAINILVSAYSAFSVVGQPFVQSVAEEERNSRKRGKRRKEAE